MRRLLPVFILLTHVLAAYGAHGPVAATCVSCGLGRKVVADQYGFFEMSFGYRLAAWDPADVDGDGTWEVLARTASMPQELGVFDPQTASWTLGPFTTPIAATDPWYPVDVLGKGYLQFVFYAGGAIRVFDPVMDTDEVLWTVPHSSVGQVIFWGRTESAMPVVFIVVSGKRYSHELVTGDSVAATRGTVNSQHRVHGYPSVGKTSLITENHYRSSFIIPGFSHLSESGGFEVFDDHGEFVTRFKFWVYEGSLEPNLHGPYLEYLQLLPEPGAETIISLRYQTDHLFNQNGWWLQRLEPNSGGYEDITHWLAPLSSAVPFDLYSEGVKYWLVPLAMSGWERRTLFEGTIVDTVPGPVNVPLRVGPILQPDSEDLFYASDTSLFVYQEDSQTGVFDDPETIQAPIDAVTIKAHPNPFNSAVTLAWSSTASSLMVYNVLGQAVTEMAIDGKTSYTWDGRDSNGREVASGVYFARLVTSDGSATAKLILLR